MNFPCVFQTPAASTTTAVVHLSVGGSPLINTMVSASVRSGSGSGSGSGTWWCVAATTPTTKDFNWQTF